jgi:asparagine synthase (glutamine-hydrolysing)
MCGIAGFIGTQTPDDDQVRACLALMRRRGPDATGVYRHRHASGREVCLLHSRLSILDLDPRSNQPMQRHGRVLVHNGEIYNYLELRQRAALHEALQTTSDTEVLLALLAEEGVAALDACEGMWAFACYDEHDGSLLLSRDRFAEKPLYLYRTARGVYFGSEIKFLAALAGRAFEPDNAQILRYLVHGYRCLHRGSATFFRDVEEFPASSWLRLGADGTQVLQRYWRPELTPDESLTFAEAAAATRAALGNSVRLRLRADVPIAFCLSGGIDSNGVIALARAAGCDVHAFTIVNRHERYAEQDMVELTVREQGLHHTSLELRTEGFLDDLRRLIDYHDAPVYTLSAYAHWLLMQAIAEHGYRIAISGIGGDELFSGYYDHQLYYLAELQADGARLAPALAAWKAHVLPQVQNPLLRDPDRFVRNPHDLAHLSPHAATFRSYLTAEWREELTDRDYGVPILRNRMLNELLAETIPPPLHEEDLNAMFYSIENRSPYLDRSLFDVCSRIPTRHLIRDGRAKAVLREALRGLVPDVLLDNRRKMGFNAPLFDLLDRNDPQVRAYLLDRSPIHQLVRREAVERLLAEPDPDHHTNLFLFYVLSARLFLEAAARHSGTAGRAEAA